MTLGGRPPGDGDEPLPREVEVLVVGAGQAGLATAYWLGRLGVPDVLVLDGAGVGQSWLDRWDSLRLFTPRRFSSLPGLRFPAGRCREPDRLEAAAYLQRYARRFALPVRTDVRVRRLSREGARFRVETDAGEVRSAQVVVATGPFRRPYVPAAAGGLDPSVHQLHSAQYRRPADVPAGEVLVVGGGNSAAQLAIELAATHQVTLASPEPLRFLPRDVLGVSLYWWLLGTGVLNARATSLLGRVVRRRGDPIIGTALRRLAEQGRVRLCTGRVTAAQGSNVVLADGGRLSVSTVLWCTGFRPDTGWIDIDAATDATGQPVHVRGASPVAGLHWMGLPWQTRLSSSILYGVGRDARETASRILRARSG